MSDQNAGPFSEALQAILRDTNPPLRRVDCPEEFLWYKFAGGEAGEGERTQLLDHAASCGYCAALLREAIEDLDTGTTAEESQILDGLKAVTLRVTADPPARQLSPNSSAAIVKLPPGRAPAAIWRWVVAAGLVLGCAAGVWKYAIPAWALGHAAALLAQGEARGRMSEFRLSDAPYAPVRISRSHVEPVPSEFVRALDWASWAPDQPRARILRARVQIAEGASADVAGDVSAALNSAAQTLGADASLSNDLAVSWASQAAERHDPAAAVRALSAVDQALHYNSSFAPALYNRALILQLLDRSDDACQALTAFLRVETDPRWREEASARIVCQAR